MNKKGQFFLIAALVIVGIIITMSAINISTKTPQTENEAFYDLSREINLESNKLIDSGIYNDKTFSERNKSISSLISNYSAANPETDILFLYGNRDSLTVVVYNRTASGFVGIGTGQEGATAGLSQSIVESSNPTYGVQGNNVTIDLGGENNLNFELQPGDNFFIVLKREVGEETLVSQE